MKNIHAVVLLSLALSACQSKSDNPKQAVEIKVPQFNSLEKLELNFSDEQQAEFSSDKLEIEDHFKTTNSEIDREIKTLSSELKSERKSLVETESRIAKIKGDMMQEFGVDASDEDSYQLVINELNRKQGAAESALESNTKTVTDLQQSIAANQSEIQSTKANIESTKISLTDYKTSKSQEEEKLKDLEGKIKDLKKTNWWDGFVFWSEDKTEEISSKQSRLEDLKSTLAKLEIKIESAQDQISADEQKTKILTDNLIRLQEELSSNLQASGLTETPELIALRIQQLQTLEESLWEITGTKERIENEISEISNLLSDLEERKLKNSPDAITYPSLEYRKAKLALSIKDGQTPEFSEVVEAVVLQNELADNVNFDTLTEAMEELKKISQVEATGPHDFKVQFDSKIESDYLKGEKIKYHPEAWALQDPMSSGEIQCYGGTNLFTTLNSLKTAPTNNLVFIYESGHVLPGYIIVENNEFVLRGIEMTAAGRAEVNYGPTANIAGNIRVLDAKQVMLVELFRDSEFDWNKVIKSMLETVQSYGFKTDQMKSFESKVAGYDTVFSSDQLNSTFFGFGSIEGEPRARDSFDKMDRLMYQKTSSSEQNKQSGGTLAYNPEFTSESCREASGHFFHASLAKFFFGQKEYKYIENDQNLDYVVASNRSLTSCEHADDLTAIFLREDKASYIELAKASHCGQVLETLEMLESRNGTGEGDTYGEPDELPFNENELFCFSGDRTIPFAEYLEY